MSLEEKYLKVTLVLEECLKSLSELDFDNFDEKYFAAVNSMKKYELMKKELSKMYEAKVLVPYDTKLLPLTKQISEKYDNIIKKTNEECGILQKELSSVQNQKKLINYR